VLRGQAGGRLEGCWWPELSSIGFLFTTSNNVKISLCILFKPELSVPHMQDFLVAHMHPPSLSPYAQESIISASSRRRAAAVNQNKTEQKDTYFVCHFTEGARSVEWGVCVYRMRVGVRGVGGRRLCSGRFCLGTLKLRERRPGTFKEEKERSKDVRMIFYIGNLLLKGAQDGPLFEDPSRWGWMMMISRIVLGFLVLQITSTQHTNHPALPCACKTTVALLQRPHEGPSPRQARPELADEATAPPCFFPSHTVSHDPAPQPTPPQTHMHHHHHDHNSPYKTEKDERHRRIQSLCSQGKCISRTGTFPLLPLRSPSQNAPSHHAHAPVSSETSNKRAHYCAASPRHLPFAH